MGAVLGAELIGGRFAVERWAGAGAMGTVYRAQDTHTGTTVALKVFRDASAHDARRFQRESRVLARLAHEGIVRYVGHGETDAGEPFLAMEWLEGENLAERLRRGTLSVEETLQLGARVADALAATHLRQVVHRDVKPSNIFLPGGAVERCKLLDFGVARLDARESSWLTESGATVGTPGYMAPEQARGDRELDGRADIFGLGCVLYRCLTGRDAFVGQGTLGALLKTLLEMPEPVRALRPEVPDPLEELLESMLAKAPIDRPESMEFVGAALRAIGKHDPAPTQAQRRPHGLSRVEARGVCVLLVSQARSLGTEAPTLRSEEFRLETAASREVLEQLRCRVRALADGSQLISPPRGDLLAQQALRAARCALALRPVLGEVSMALVPGRAASHAALASTDPGAETLLGAAGTIAVHPALAGLLDARVRLSRRHDRYLLERELQGRELPDFRGPFLGREEALSQLEQLFDATLSERSTSVATVTGSPGSGKTRLLVEFLRGLGEVPFWRARGDDAAAEAEPLALLAQLVQSAADLRSEDSAAEKRRKLEAHLRERLPLPQRSSASALLGELCALPPERESLRILQAAQRNPAAMAEQTRESLRALLHAEARGQGLVLVVDDAHMAGEASLKLLHSVLGTLGGVSVLLLLAGEESLRERFQALWPRRARHALRLGALTPAAVREYVTQALRRPSSAQVARLAGLACGHPLALQELCAAERRGERQIPASALCSAEGDLLHRTEQERLVLRAASVFGVRFPTGGVCALLEGLCAAEEVQQRLESLRAEGWLLAEDPSPSKERWLRFGWALHREAALASLTPEDLAAAQRLAAPFLRGS